MKILFICKSNQFRSQMAAAIYNKITGTSDAISAGTYVGFVEGEPEGVIIEKCFRTPDFFELMEENEMNLRMNQTKLLTPYMIDEADVVVSMAEEPYVPDFLSATPKLVQWDVENPSFATREISENTYERIKRLVEEFINHA